MSASELPDWAKSLDLQPHPEGGWFRETWRSEVGLPNAVLPAGYTGDRAAGTAIYFVLMPGQQSAWRTVRSSEIWLHHRGAPVQLDLGGDGEAPGDPTPIIVGPDIEAGQHPQALVPPGVWQRARPVGDEAALVSCVVVPGFDFADFRLED
ncbi:cupin domain-containing protein [Gordonia metallireducens]|uniref:cupin domain-containing protein n=1 Tax=Gordonia metallireducens TaxID=2897779 RepID=UPI001E5D49D6|nr:cupin domain-containing protein [Gordonia metallireducens]